MACKQSNADTNSCKSPSLGGRVRARSVAAALTLGAGLALSAVAAALSSATAQELDWATSAGGSSNDHGRGIAADLQGNSYVTGFFRNEATFGAGEPNETELTAAGEDMFLAKYDRDGGLVWATSAGGSGTSFTVGEGIAATLNGSSYVIGRFEGGIAIFGAGEPNETELTSNIFQAEIFIAKYDRGGALVWATSAGGTGGDQGRGIATDPGGNSYVTGSFQDKATFGAGEPNETELTATGGIDLGCPAIRFVAILKSF